MNRSNLAAIFDEWARRYQTNPQGFGPAFNELGQPVEGYGANCAVMFEAIASELGLCVELRLVGGVTENR